MKIIIALALLLFSCKQATEKAQICSVLKSKHMEEDAIGNYGNFRINHYFLYEDGTVERVSTEDFIRYEAGDSLCYSPQ